MFTPENIVLFFIAIGVSLTVAVVYDRLWPNPVITREGHLEEEVERLTSRVEALQETIDLLAGRVWALQKENERLKNELARLVPFGNWRATETGVVRNALEKLSAEELRRLVFERFRPVFDGFSSQQSLQAQRLALLEYAENHAQLNTLRAAIGEINPAAFG